MYDGQVYVLIQLDAKHIFLQINLAYLTKKTEYECLDYTKHDQLKLFREYYHEEQYSPAMHINKDCWSWSDMRVLTKKRVINLMMINRRQNLSQNIFRDQLLFLKITNIYVEYKQKKGMQAWYKKRLNMRRRTIGLRQTCPIPTYLSLILSE